MQTHLLSDKGTELLSDKGTELMRTILLVTGLCLLVTLPVAAQKVRPIQQHNSNSIWFDNWIGLCQAMLHVASQDGDVSDVFAKQGSPVFVLRGRRIVDGVYRYELRAATGEMVKNRDYDKDGILGNNEEYTPKALYITGFFVVKRGLIIRPEESEE